MDRSPPVQYFLLYIHYCRNIHFAGFSRDNLLADEYVFNDTDIGLPDNKQKTDGWFHITGNQHWYLHSEQNTWRISLARLWSLHYISSKGYAEITHAMDIRNH
jgi:hypothetical protein